MAATRADDGRNGARRGHSPQLSEGRVARSNARRLRGQTTASSGGRRPGVLKEPEPPNVVERVQRHILEQTVSAPGLQILDAPVPQTAYLSAGGPPLSNPSSYVGRGSLSICTMRLGGRCHDRIYHVDRADEFDVTHSGFFLNSSLAPVLRFRRSFVSVRNVLKGIKLHGFSEARVAALWCRWRAVVRLGPTGLVTSLDPWTHWIPPDLHGFQMGHGHLSSSQ